MQTLGIETSCDETAAAVIENKRTIRSSIVASSVTIHQKYGGIVPEQAARAQLSAIIPVIHESLGQASTRPADLDAIAVTVGPGLIGSLLVGVETAKTLAFLWKKPIIPVNHLLAHFYAEELPAFPFIGLLASGGHTELIHVTGHGAWTSLGGTRDDAAGEAFDKTARVLNLPYPGGPALAAAARGGDPKRFILPRPMIETDDGDFSFSGLKTAVIRAVEDTGPLTEETRRDLAAGIQEAIVDSLVAKTVRAAEKEKVSAILIAGGVAANVRLREKFRAKTKRANLSLSFPPPHLCTDNAVMVARCAVFNNTPVPWEEIQADPSLSLEQKPPLI